MGHMRRFLGFLMAAKHFDAFASLEDALYLHLSLNSLVLSDTSF